MAASQRSRAADVGHCPGAECCTFTGATPQLITLGWMDCTVQRICCNRQVT